MKAALRTCALLSLAFGLSACNESKTPTEPAAVAATPTPTAVAGQPASASGRILTQSSYAPFNGLPVAEATITCQGRSTITRADGTYELGGIVSGETILKVDWPSNNTHVEWSGALYPGTNTVNIFVDD